MGFISIAFGFLNEKFALISGIIGFEVNQYLQDFLGKTGLTILLIFLFIAYIVLRYKVNFDVFIHKVKQKRAARQAAALLFDLEKENLNYISDFLGEKGYILTYDDFCIKTLNRSFNIITST